MKTLTFTLAFLFGVLSLAPNMQGAQLFKLTEVVEHFHEHQKSEENFSTFIDFIVDHYFKNRETNKNEQELPFKSVVAAPVLIALEKIEVIPVTFQYFIEPISKPNVHQLSLPTQARLNPIWNPPQQS
jgi:hypothetical protein